MNSIELDIKRSIVVDEFKSVLKKIKIMNYEVEEIAERFIIPAVCLSCPVWDSVLKELIPAMRSSIIGQYLYNDNIIKLYWKSGGLGGGMKSVVLGLVHQALPHLSPDIRNLMEFWLEQRTWDIEYLTIAHESIYKINKIIPRNGYAKAAAEHKIVFNEFYHRETRMCQNGRVMLKKSLWNDWFWEEVIRSRAAVAPGGQLGITISYNGRGKVWNYIDKGDVYNPKHPEQRITEKLQNQITMLINL
jgi:hypothetical protein